MSFGAYLVLELFAERLQCETAMHLLQDLSYTRISFSA
jgi:hypothetical protein